MPNGTILNEKIEYFGTPLIFCAKHDFLEGFKAIAERGGDITKRSVGGTVSPIGEALNNSPVITLYIAQEHPEAFDAFYKNWQQGYELVRCDDLRVWDIRYSRWGGRGDGSTAFHLSAWQSNVDLTMIQYLIEHGADYLIVNRDLKCHALDFAKHQYEKFGDDSRKQAYERLKDAAARR